MAKSKATFGKREKEKDKIKKRQEKEEKKQERKANSRNGNNLDEMMAFIDENGNISNTPPDRSKFRETKLEDIAIGVEQKQDDYDLQPQRTGTVIKFNDEKGFGFIKDSTTSDEIFVHSTDINGRLQQNDKVSFEVEYGPKGLKAVRVEKK
jgi:cold shock CspA family protein